MRGEELKEIRRQNLLRLRQQHTLEQIAERTGTNSVYLSQIANRVVQKNGKSPRALSDAYAGKIERGLGLPEGWMDQDHSPATIEATAKVQVPAESAQRRALDLLPLASPRSAAVLELIAKAAEEGRLSDADLGLLNQIAERLSSEPGTYDKLRKKADDADRASE